MTHTCPACGWPALREPPRSRSGGGSYEICPSCGFEFGVTDDDLRIAPEAWREAWVAGGCRWNSRHRQAPEKWDPAAQLARLKPARKAQAAP